jgi:hypothetical protein
VTKHRLPLRNGEEKSRIRAWLDRCPVGQGWRVEFLPPVRSTDQNARLWAFLDDIAAQKEWDGKKRTSEAWKDLFTACLRSQEIVRGLEGGIVALGARTSEMSPEEMSDLLQLIETWGAENGVTFTDSLGSVGKAPAEGRADGPDSDVQRGKADPSAREVSEGAR